jgi:hypothetical protein
MGEIIAFVLGLLVGGFAYRAYAKASSVGSEGKRDR